MAVAGVARGLGVCVNCGIEAAGSGGRRIRKTSRCGADPRSVRRSAPPRCKTSRDDQRVRRMRRFSTSRGGSPDRESLASTRMRGSADADPELNAAVEKDADAVTNEPASRHPVGSQTIYATASMGPQRRRRTVHPMRADDVEHIDRAIATRHDGVVGRRAARAGLQTGRLTVLHRVYAVGRPALGRPLTGRRRADRRRRSASTVASRSPRR